MEENKFKVKVALLEKCASIVDELNSTIEAREQEIVEQEAIPEDERTWRYYNIPEYRAQVKAYKQIISHLEKLL